jgi:dTDP-4-dehydrorhamnose 3,5-epimerase
VRVTRGAVFDVAVDIRRSSPTFAQWRGFNMTAEDHKQIWIPEGFAHGFLALTEVAEMQYKTTAPHSSDLDRAIRWDDDTIGIDWPLDVLEPLVSARDASAPTLAEAHLFD